MSTADANTMRNLVKDGKALPAPGQDRPGRFQIRNKQELQDAIRAVGRASGGAKGRALVRRYIIRRARQLGLLELVPDTWNTDGSLKG
jgi:ribosomal protein L19E